jgi:hypothetical protein
VKKVWHLDAPYQKDFFDHLWSRAAQDSLLKLFKFTDESDKPVLSMLPDGIGPSAAAMAASLYFLPGISKSPEPHCKIALYPGFHFVRGLKSVAFNPTIFRRLTQDARSMMLGATVPPALEKLERTYKDIDEVFFYWLFKCDRLWSRYGSIDPKEIGPRSRFGMGDEYNATIDIIDCEDPLPSGLVRGPYDLLIYCPYFHSPAWGEGNQLAADLVTKLKNFKAHRKLVLVRSPYDFWAREIERRTDIKGISFHKNKVTPSLRTGMEIKLIDQFVNVSEALDLFEAIEKNLQSESEWEIAKELKSILRFLLISIHPRKNQAEFEERVTRLQRLKERLTAVFPKDALEVFEKIIARAADDSFKTKKDHLLSLQNEKTEIWVTKDGDRRSLEELSAEIDMPLNVRLMDRWTPAGKRQDGHHVILTRVDREGDLDLVSYLKSQDVLLLSSWELVLKTKYIENAWERSENWRNRADGTSFAGRATSTPIFDPVLELADYILNTHANALALKPREQLPAIEPSEQTWWDEDDINPVIESKLNRSDILEDRADLRNAREIKLKGDLAVFLAADSEVQVLREGAENDFESIDVSELKAGDMLVLFRDSERSSIFDLIMDQLERSSIYGEDAKRVRVWKRELLKTYISSKTTILKVQESLTKRGFSVNALTIRSWISGPTMAPQRMESMSALVEVLQLGTAVPVTYQSVIRIRTLARVLGRAINELIVSRNPEKLNPEFRKVIEEAEIDLSDLAASLDIREVVEVAQFAKGVSAPNLKKVFNV